MRGVFIQISESGILHHPTLILILKLPLLVEVAALAHLAATAVAAAVLVLFLKGLWLAQVYLYVEGAIALVTEVAAGNLV